MQKTFHKSTKTNINDMFSIFKSSNDLDITLVNSFQQFDFTLDLLSPNIDTLISTVQSKIDTLSSPTSSNTLVEILLSFLQEFDFYSKNLQKTIDFIQKDNMKNRSFIIQNKLEQLSIININKTFLSNFILQKYP